jgi:hypothetical protein
VRPTCSGRSSTTQPSSLSLLLNSRITFAFNAPPFFPIAYAATFRGPVSYIDMMPYCVLGLASNHIRYVPTCSFSLALHRAWLSPTLVIDVRGLLHRGLVSLKKPAFCVIGCRIYPHFYRCHALPCEARNSDLFLVYTEYRIIPSIC